MTSRLPIFLVVATVAMNALGIGIILPVMPQLLVEMGQPDIASAAAIGGFLSLAFAGMQVLFGPLLGALSDQYGRKPILIGSMAITGFDYVILAVSPVLWLFFVARLVSGTTSATFSVANAILADVTPPEKRAAQFGLTGGAFGLGFVLGPVMGGLLGELGPRAPFWAAAVLCFLAATLCALVLPETLNKAKRRPVRLRDAIPFAAFLKLRHKRSILPLVRVNFVDALAGMVYPAVWAYFAIAQFGWGPAMVGWSLAAYGLCFAAVQAGLIRVFISRLGEARTALFGLSAGVVGFVILSGLSSGMWAFLLTPLFAARAVSATALSGLMSQRTGEDAQGELQGILAAVTGASTLIAIPLLTSVFAFANAPERSNPWPGAPFAVAAIFSVSGLIMLILSLRTGTDNSALKKEEAYANVP